MVQPPLIVYGGALLTDSLLYLPKNTLLTYVVSSAQVIFFSLLVAHMACVLPDGFATGKNISFLAASASRAAIHNSLATKGNLADITAKAGAQTIVACMIGKHSHSSRLCHDVFVYLNVVLKKSSLRSFCSSRQGRVVLMES